MLPVGDRFHLDPAPPRKPGDLYDGAGGAGGGKGLCIDLVHGVEVIQVGQEDRDFDDMRQGQPVRRQHGFEIDDRLRGLGRDPGGDRPSVRGQGELPGNKAKISDRDPGGVGADRSRESGGNDRILDRHAGY